MFTCFLEVWSHWYAYLPGYGPHLVLVVIVMSSSRTMSGIVRFQWRFLNELVDRSTPHVGKNLPGYVLGEKCSCGWREAWMNRVCSGISRSVFLELYWLFFNVNWLIDSYKITRTSSTMREESVYSPSMLFEWIWKTSHPIQELFSFNCSSQNDILHPGELYLDR